MGNSEDYLKDHICDVCHVAMMADHPELEKAQLGFIKCPLCGNTKKLEKNISLVNRIIYGRDK